MIPYGHQNINQADRIAVDKTLQSDWLTQGPRVAKFEEALAKYVGAKYAVAVSNGTAGLHLAYLAAKIKKGDEVITTANTFVATSNMILAVGARPVFCDIKPGTYNIDEDKIEQLITKKTKAIVPVDFGGRPCEYNKIKAIAKKHKLLIIDDACHALGASYKGKRIGNGSIADLTIFSFHPVKSITTGEGGAVVTNSKKLYQRLKLLRSHGVVKNSNGFIVMSELGYNYRLTDIQSALGLSQLKRLNKFVNLRRQRALLYNKLLASVPQIITPVPVAKGLTSSWHLYVICAKRAADRLPLYNFLKSHGIGVNFHYPAVYKHPYYQKIGYKGVNCQEAERYTATAITIPLYPDLSLNSVKYICNIIKLFFSC